MNNLFRTAFSLIAAAAALFCLTPLASTAAPDRAFSPQRDTLAFCNETVWHYSDGKAVSRPDPAAHGKGTAARPAGAESYNRRCFVMSRGVMQFWKFARFEPSRPKVSEKEYAALVRRVARISVWRNALPRGERIVIPGYANLRAFSAAQGRAIRANLGLGWPTYFRPGNLALPFKPSAADQRRLAAELRAQLGRGEPAILWLANFPSLNINHAVIAYSVKDLRKGGTTSAATPRDFQLAIYDPNLDPTAPGAAPTLLRWNSAHGTFSFSKTFYFPGGPVSVRHVFTSSWD
ncbi:hypothetical protein DB346_11655 [Verrucomicrobia bacterium LW23]|nr:hypothetical protein DB346_11655 [Verrucomicrobia bacterium LW23]